MPAALSIAARIALVLAMAIGCGACAGRSGAPESTPWTAPSKGQRNVSSGYDAERLFPLVDGHVYHYVTQNETGDRGLLVARVHRADASSGELRFPSGVRRFEYTAEGVRIASGAGEGAWLLRTPVAQGASWRGEHGGTTTVAAVGMRVETPAGTFEDCVRTLEQRGGDRPVRFETTFCPGVGVVAVEAASGASYERADLKSYGPAVSVGPDGVQVLR